MTFLLKDSLSGNSKTFMMAAISPAEDNADETVSTLRFASSVKKIKTVAKQNVDKKDEMISNLQAELKQLKAQCGKVGAGDGAAETEMSEDLALKEQHLQNMMKDYE